MNNNPQRLREIYLEEREALQRWADNEYGQFFNNLTYRAESYVIRAVDVDYLNLRLRA